MGNQDTIYMEVGTPPQPVNAIVRVTSSELVLVDGACGTKALDCPSYCREPAFLNLYCNPNCRTVTDVEWPLVCVEANFRPFLFLSNESSSFEVVHSDWKAQYSGYKPLYGNLAADRVQFDDAEFENGSWVGQPYAVERLEFGQVLLGDPGLFLGIGVMSGVITAIFGLGPGDRSFASQLFRAGLVPQPLISMVGFNDRRFPSGMLVGELNEFSCTNWTWFPAVDPKSWTLEVTSIKLMGVEVEGPKTVVANPIGLYNYVPNSVMRRLEREYDVRPLPFVKHCLSEGSFCYSAPCGTSLSLDFDS
ncbi:hypothetical protein M3Y99_00763300 [Aphelenchoides fujianensis]|nr:hypothetical protein M3Y99_00763300 [Aphelenchoides fujianensis]